MPWEVLDPETKHTIDMAVHVILIPGGNRGKVLYYGGYLVDDTHTYDIETRTIDPAPPLPGYNLFCSGHSMLADGRILVAGGQLELYDEENKKIPAPTKATDPDHPHPHFNMSWGGERRCSLYLPNAKAWVRVDDLSLDPAGNPNSGGRWYPTLCTLPNGEVLAVGGHPDLRELYPTADDPRHNTNAPERYNPNADSWTLLASNPPAENQTTGAYGDSSDYQRNHLLPSGLVFFSSPVRGLNRFYNAFEGRFLDDADHLIDLPPVNQNDPHEAEHDQVYRRVGADFTSTLLPLLHQENFRPRVHLMGGANAKVIDLGNPAAAQWQNTVQRDWPQAPPPRYFVTSVILPTGEVFFAGGTAAHHEGEDAQTLCVLQGETYDPGINWATGTYSQAEQWTTTPDQATVQRYYHGVAILLPDGSVWTGGSNGPSDDVEHPNDFERRIEIYTPPYFNDQAARPILSNVPQNIGYAYTFRFNTTQANSISRVVFIRCGAATHGFNMEQRYISVAFTVINNNTIEVTVPFTPEVIPPGRYMLWVVNDQDLPCQWASFIRISKQHTYITADFSTFAMSEVEALGTGATFNEAAYIVYDGFLPDEVVIPSRSLVWEDDPDTPVPDVTVTLDPPKYEGGFNNKDTGQRIVYPCHITFAKDTAFDFVPEDPGFRNVLLKAKMGNFAAQATLTLSRKLNPRMRDGDPHWLSIDLRAFSTRPGLTPYADIEHPEGGNAPYTYIQSLLDKFNTLPADDNHPFEDLPTDQATNLLPLYSHDDDDNPVYNYAVARVRFRAEEITALNVRVFFRLWTTGWGALSYDTSQSYRLQNANDGANAIALLGLTGDEIINVPCFAEKRKDDMETQTDLTNRKQLVGDGANEVWTYFGCWLDFNQGGDSNKRFILAPGNNNGPFNGELLTLQQLIRGLHQCLVAEIHYVPDDVIPPAATPASSDSLAQRNLLIDESDNPGGFASHLVHHTFEIKPSPFRFPTQSPTQPTLGTTTAVGIRHQPDELVIDWGNLPREAHATIYLPQVDVDEVLRFAARRQNPGNLTKTGPNTLLCKVTDIGFIPIPGPFGTAFPALISIQLPPNITKGQKFTVVIRQVEGRRIRVLGATQFDIHVKTAPEILPRLKRNFSVLKHIALSIPESNRWHPVFALYLDQLADRVRAMGGNPDEIAPSSTGSGRPERKCCYAQWLFAAILVLLIVLLGLLPLNRLGLLAALCFVLVVGVAWYWSARCKPTACNFINVLLFGLGVGGAVLGIIALLLGSTGTTLLVVLAVLAVIIGLLMIVAAVWRCWMKC